MITYEQIGDTSPRDTRASTDDGGAELVKFDEACGVVAPITKVSLDAAKQVDGRWVFLIDGSEAGELMEVLEYDQDENSLTLFVEEANSKAIDEAQALLEPKD